MKNEIVSRETEDQIVLRALEIMQTRNEELQKKVDTLAPLAEQAILVGESGESISMATAADRIAEKMTKFYGVCVKLGAVKLYKILRELNIMREGANQALQKYVDMGCFRNTAPICQGKMRSTVRVTPKGVEYIIMRILKADTKKENKILGIDKL